VSWLLGGAPGSGGTIAVRDSDSLYKSGGGSVGVQGTGTLLVNNSGALQSTGSLILGAQAGGTGNATVFGPVSKWTVTGSLVAGAQGTANQEGIGNITITNGGWLEISGSDLVLGQAAGGIGNLKVGGKGSQVTFNGPTFYVGQGGAAEMDITDGGVVGPPATGAGPASSPANPGSAGNQRSGSADCLPTPVSGPPGPKTVIGSQAGSIGLATVAGSNSVWQVEGSLTVGEQGNASQAAQGTLIIQNGGTVSTSGAYVTLGQEEFSLGKLILDGPGSSLQGGATLEVGRHGDGTMEIRNGGRNSLTSPILGCLPFSSGTIRVMGAAAMANHPCSNRSARLPWEGRARAGLKSWQEDSSRA
jgi:T5SS/PEP-CTERM-associated repeat protein